QGEPSRADATSLRFRAETPAGQLFRGRRLQLDHQPGKRELVDAEQRARRLAARLVEAARDDVGCAQESVDVGRVEIEPYEIREFVARRLQHGLEIPKCLLELLAQVARVQRLAVLVHGGLSGAVEDAARVRDFDRLREGVLVLPLPGVDLAMFHGISSKRFAQSGSDESTRPWASRSIRPAPG